MNKKLITAVVVLVMSVWASAQSSLMEVENLYMVGNNTGWTVAWKLPKISDHVFYFEGDLPDNASFRASAWGPLNGSVDNVYAGPQIHPVVDGAPLDPTTNPTQAIDFNNMSDGDKNWSVATGGFYRIIFNLEEAKITISTDVSEKLPLLVDAVYAVGNATPGNWEPSGGTPFMADENDPYIFTYQTKLKQGDFKLPLSNEVGWGGFWIHPDQNVSFGTDGLTNCPIRVYNGAPDNLWTVSDEGIYKVTINLQDMTMSAEQADKVVAKELFFVGEMTNWTFQPMNMVEPNVFEYTIENAEAGKKFRASLCPGWGDHFRPEADLTELAINNQEGLDIDLKLNQSEDYNWVTKEPGKYKIRFDLNKMKVSANNDDIPASVSEITATEDVTEEYFTLQGMRVENVTSGGIYIQKKGTSVKKVIIR